MQIASGISYQPHGPAPPETTYGRFRKDKAVSIKNAKAHSKE